MKEHEIPCELCGEVYDLDELIPFDDRLICPECLENETTLCACCGQRIWLTDNAGFTERLYCKHDGSLSNGFELVTHPMSLEYHQEEMPWPEVLRTARSLASAAEERGTDAAGIAYHAGGKLNIMKKAKPAHVLRFRVPAETSVVMGHTRYATQGDAKKAYNAHPFQGQIGNKKFALAHNGVLLNDRLLQQAEDLPKTHIGTDSYVAVQLLEKQNALNFNSLRKVAEQVQGTFVFTVLDAQDNLYFVHGDNPL